MIHPAPKVLIVDSDGHRVLRLSQTLASQGYQVLTSQNGAAGLLAMHQESPDLVLLAGRMPVMNGLQVLTVMREDSQVRDLPAILLAPGDGPEELVKGWEAGADLCIPENTPPVDVSLAVRRAMQASLGALQHARGGDRLQPAA